MVHKLGRRYSQKQPRRFLRHGNLRPLKMPLIHDATSKLLAPLHVVQWTPFQMGCTTGQTHYYFPVVISFRTEIPEAKDMSAIRNGIAVCTAFVTYLSAMDVVRNLHRDSPRTVLEMKLARNSVRLQTIYPASRRPSDTPCETRRADRDAEQALDSVSIYSLSSVLEQNGSWTNADVPEMYICSPLNHCTTSALEFQRCWRFSFSCTSYQPLLR